MKRGLCFLLAALLLGSLTACGKEPEPRPILPQIHDDPIQVVTTAFPYYDFAKQIGGALAEVTLIVPAGRETHSFEPTPMDVVTVSQCDVFLYNGGESEYWVEEILESVGEDIPVVSAMMELVTLEEEEIAEGMQTSAEGEEEDGDEIEYDEHIWTSPANAIDLLWGVCGALCKADWDNADYYIDRAVKYEQQIREIDLEFWDLMSRAQRKTLVFGDRFPLLYFCREYGLSYYAAFHGCASDTEPSLATLKFLIDKVNEREIPVIYTIELSSQKIAEAIAEATGAKVVTFQSCQQISREDWENGETYVSLMRRNIEAIREGLL